MISYVRGELVEIEEDKVIVDVGGIGFGIYMSGRAAALLPSPGSEVRLHTYMNVKEDAMQLFGFLTKDDLSVFRLLIGVNGIGPKAGLNILSSLSPDDLRFAVVANDVKAIMAAPGIGKKTAEKLILELKDKLKLEDVLEHGVSETDLSQTSGANQVQSEAIQALTALGYGSTEALQAVKKAGQEEGDDVETLLKKALKKMAF